MWKLSDQIAATLAANINDSPEFHGIALTMTGELADCFHTRAEGVAKILEQVTRLFPSPLVYVYCVDGKWRSPAQAAREPWLTAASNWHALANWAGRFLQNQNSDVSQKPSTLQQRGILVDIGSTTIDIVAISPEEVLTKSKTDSDRLKKHELIYTGVERSNISGLLRYLPLHGKRCPIMNEQFATTRDAYVWLRLLDEAPQDSNTCDSRPMTRLNARYRLARLVGEDGSTITDCDLDAIASTILKKQAALLRSQKTTKQPNFPLISSGHGDFLIREALKDLLHSKSPYKLSQFSLSDQLGQNYSRVAPALAVAQLARETADI
jgi:probable H4MPT-linked C1 transfer pathway protein